MSADDLDPKLIEDYLNGPGYTISTYLNYNLPPDKKPVASTIARHMRDQLEAMVESGEAIRGPSKGGKIAYFRPEAAVKQPNYKSRMYAIAFTRDQGRWLAHFGEKILEVSQPNFIEALNEL